MGTAKGIKDTILSHLKSKSVNLSEISVIGCDGTVVNTGFKAGIIRLMEEEFNKPIQWFICQLHFNELPLRHLLLHLDGKTTGPKCFSGAIGSQLQICETMPITEFTVIPTILPEITRSDLSTDQKYLYDFMTAISTGVVSSDLANIKPGSLNHSRWLTAANRILRLYATKTDPEEKLVILATYVMRVYGPMWFKIKCNPSCINGAKHLWETISLSRYLNADFKTIIDKVIQRNGYFGHPENLLIAMLADDREIIRDLAYRRIVKARTEKAAGLRMFKVPSFNFDAEDYTNIITWRDCEITEPPLTLNISDEDLKAIVKSGLGTYQNIKDFPCHTQAVERCIKLVTEASIAVCGKNKRDGFIRARLLSRQRMPTFDTKKQFDI